MEVSAPSQGGQVREGGTGHWSCLEMKVDHEKDSREEGGEERKGKEEEERERGRVKRRT